MGKLKGRIALVTGAAQARGIGQGIVGALLAQDAAGIVFTDIDVEAGNTTLEVLAKKHGPEKLLFMRHDAASENDWHDALEATLKKFGRLDILVNNAGTSLPGCIETLSLEELRRGMSINFDSQFIGIKTCMDALAKQATELPGGAAIINNSSMAAYIVDPANLPYHVSKSASRMLTMCAAKELGPKHIRVNSVHYGPTITPMMERAIEGYVANGQFPDAHTARTAMAAMSPLGITGTIEDAGALVAFLASDEARYITGAAYWQDGGCFMQY